MPNMQSESTNEGEASAAVRVLRDKSNSKSAKIAAGLAIAQIAKPRKHTSSESEIAALQILRSKSNSKKSKVAAGLAIAQRPKDRNEQEAADKL